MFLKFKSPVLIGLLVVSECARGLTRFWTALVGGSIKKQIPLGNDRTKGKNVRALCAREVGSPLRLCSGAE